MLPKLPEFKSGTVWLVGAGPGDAGLLTRLAERALLSAEVVVYDALVNEEILQGCQDSAELIYAGKRGGKPSARQSDISITLIELARRGKRVLRLKGGDPFVFGRGGEEALALAKAGIEFRIVPGVTAGIGGLAYAGIPVTHRDTNNLVTFVTGHGSSGEVPDGVNWSGLAQFSPVIVLYMALKHLPQIADKLIAGGRSLAEPVALVANASTAGQQVVVTSLGQCRDQIMSDLISPPVIIVIGEVVNFRPDLDWFKTEVASLTNFKAKLSMV
ncbi:MAG: uroporphyrinogen-III C-methyltransferase [Candidatus Pacebacteria bacterium]|nr:uroporphyrinogen-III C-methyltransferase [Candidatus Paceibacterota bacterium]